MGFTFPMALLFALVLLPMVYYYRSTYVEARKYRLLSFLLRALAVLLFVVALARPFVDLDKRDRHTIHLFDISDSVDLQAMGNLIKEVRKSSGKPSASDSHDYMTFAGNLHKLQDEEIEKGFSHLEKTGPHEFRMQTQVARAMRLGALRYPSGKVKRMILYTDGHDTGGELESQMQGLESAGVEVWLKKMPALKSKEFSIQSLESSHDRAYTGEQVSLTVNCLSNHDAELLVRLFNRDVVIGKKSVEFKADVAQKVIFDVPVQSSGKSEYRVEISGSEDRFPLNNFASHIIDVKGSAKVLALHKNPRDLKYLTRALKKQNIELFARGRTGMPASMDKLLLFDAVVLANFPAIWMNQRQMEMIRSYVSDFGGGLLMLGSENSFGLGGYHQTPVEAVLPLVSRHEKEKESPSLALALVIDKSGSMSGVPIEMAKMAAKAAVDLLSYRDHVGVVVFDSQAWTVQKMTSAQSKSEIKGAIDTFAASGGTSMYPGMQIARQMLEQVTAKIKHMILLTDGRSTPGPFEDTAAQLANSGITVSSVAMGGGADRALLKVIAENGRGRYYETLDPESVPQIFTKETMEAAKSSIKEEPFQAVISENSAILDGLNIADSPYLLGYVIAKMKPTAKVHLLTESGDPLLATGQFGLGNSAAFTSGATEKWAGEWMEWRAFPRFWAQLLRRIVRKSEGRGMAIQTRQRGKRMILDLNYLDKHGAPVVNAEFKVSLFSGTQAKREIEVEERGLGKYRMTFEKADLDKASLVINDKSNGKVRSLHYPGRYPREYELKRKLPDCIESLPRWREAEIKEHKPITHNVDIHRFVVCSGLISMLGSVLLRRLG